MAVSNSRVPFAEEAGCHPASVHGCFLEANMSPGQGPVRPAVGDPASAGGWTR